MNPLQFWRRVVAAVRTRVAEMRVYMSSRQAGVLVNEDTAMTLSGWWACVSVISRNVAALPWQVYEKSAKGRQPLDGNITWLLNNQPNPEMTAFAFREAMMAHVLNWGNAYAEIQRDLAGRVTALWLITPDRVTPARADDGSLVYRVTNDAGVEVVLRADQVFHLHGLGFDGVSGYSPVRMAARSIGVGIAQDVFGQSFYANGTVMGAVVEVGATMSPEQIGALEAHYNERHAGPDKAFKVKVSPAGTKVHQMGMPLTDAEFIASRKFTVTECARWLGVPPHKIADLERSTNNNIEHQGIEFVTDAIVPWAVRLEQEANSKLIGYRAQGRVFTKLTVNALMRGDSAARASYYKTMVQMGAMSINEVRELEELNSLGDAGDAHLVQLNQTTLEYLVANPGAKAAAPAPTPAETADPAAEDDTPAKPTNVIRAQALEWARSQRKQA
jgi:HK97 family phage portal protein